MTNAEIGIFIDHMHDKYGDIWTEDQVRESHYNDMPLYDAIYDRSREVKLQHGNLSALCGFSADDE